MITVIAGAAVFAEGAQEKEFNDFGEPLTLSGTLEFTDPYHPGLNDDGEVYGLMYHPFVDDDIDVRDGDTITVEGFLMPGPRWQGEGIDQYLRVTKAVIDGKEYEVDFYGRQASAGYGPCFDDDNRYRGYNGSRGGMRSRGGMMNGGFSSGRRW